VGVGDFSSHEIVGCEDPRGGTAAVYPTISECEQALNTLTLHTAPYDPDYVEGLYSDYTCSDDDDVYPEAKGKIGNSDSSCSSGYVTSSNEYMVDYDSDLLVEVESYLRDDDIYPPALGEIRFDPIVRRALHDGVARRWQREQSQRRSKLVKYRSTVHHTRPDPVRQEGVRG
jgi:hypothetical protein